MAGQEPLIEAVVFDVGETLVDETRLWADWARWLGVTPLTMAGLLGAAIAMGEDHRAPFRWLRPDRPLRTMIDERRAAGEAVDPTAGDLCRPVRPA